MMSLLKEWDEGRKILIPLMQLSLSSAGCIVRLARAGIRRTSHILRPAPGTFLLGLQALVRMMLTVLSVG